MFEASEGGPGGTRAQGHGDAWPFPGLVYGPYPQRAVEAWREPRARRMQSRRWARAARTIATAVTAGSDGPLADGPALEERHLHRAAAALAETVGWEPRWQQVFAARAMLGQVLVEMATGEGKTYAVALAAAAAALAGTPVHAVTSNDYLAQRDAARLQPFYARLGLRCTFVTETMDADARRRAYAGDVTYCTARELGFDFLRDGLLAPRSESALEARMARGAQGQQPVLRGLCLALLDEADTLLIDEAAVPLVLARAEADAAAVAFLREAWERSAAWREGEHFRLGARASRVVLLPPGQEDVRAWPAQPHPLHGHPVHRAQAMELAVLARHGLQRDRDYVLRDGGVALVDMHTGRASVGRAWSQGLHQLVELKEGVAASQPQATATRITTQQFFARYLRLAGVSGTLREARRELWRCHGLRVLVVPAHQPRRVAPPGLTLHRDSATLREVVVERVAEEAAAGRPVLVGMDTVEAAAGISALLTQRAIPHAVLHARQDDHEAAVIAAAGRPGQVTVATSLAGRGSDIALTAESVAAGGLHVVLCQLNASPRIDRQFIGRAGRQGQPGSAERHVAADGPLLRRWLPECLLHWLVRPGVPRALGAWAVSLAQQAEAYTQSQQRVTLMRWAQAQSLDLAFSREHPP